MTTYATCDVATLRHLLGLRDQQLADCTRAMLRASVGLREIMGDSSKLYPSALAPFIFELETTRSGGRLVNRGDEKAVPHDVR